MKSIKRFLRLGPIEDYPKKVKNLKPGDVVFGLDDGTFLGTRTRVKTISSDGGIFKVSFENDSHSFSVDIPKISGNRLAYTSQEQLNNYYK
jgi:hypothetical protein